MPHLVLSTARWRAAAIVLALLSVPATAVAIEVTGGLPNQLVHIYYLPVVAGALFLPRRWSIAVTCLAILLTCPLVDYVHLWLGKPLFYKNSNILNFGGSGWIVRPLAFAFITLVASRVRQSIQQLAASNATLRIEVSERMHTEQRLETALRAELELEAQLEHQAFHDALTGLANRATFKARLDHALEMAEANGRSVGLLFLDVDDFKAVNDRWGPRHRRRGARGAGQSHRPLLHGERDAGTPRW